MIPKDVKVLSFDPETFLKISIPLSVYQTIWNLTGTLPLYLVIAYGLSYLLESVIHTPPAASLIIVLLALASCVAINLRGAILTVQLKDSKYRVATAGSFAPFQGVLKVEMNTTPRNGTWETVLSVIDLPIAKNVSNISADDAERPFAAFARAFFVEDGTKKVLADQKPDTGTTALAPIKDNSECYQQPRRTEVPLIVLVHGTWGCKSKWAIPDQSLLVSAIAKGIASDVEFRRFPWSGCNRGSARMRAATRLRRTLESELLTVDRLIFILAHSHGGNIAVRAVEALSSEHQTSVRAVLMGTPFLRSVQRFDVRDVFKLLPAIRANLVPADLYFGGLGGHSGINVAFSTTFYS